MLGLRIASFRAPCLELSIAVDVSRTPESLNEVSENVSNVIVRTSSERVCQRRKPISCREPTIVAFADLPVEMHPEYTTIISLARCL